MLRWWGEVRRGGRRSRDNKPLSAFNPICFLSICVVQQQQCSTTSRSPASCVLRCASCVQHSTTTRNTMQKYLLQLLQGTFIVCIGITGYLWDPRAKSALISGCVFGMCTLHLPSSLHSYTYILPFFFSTLHNIGGLNILWGAIMFQGGQKWVDSASLIVNSVSQVEFIHL